MAPKTRCSVFRKKKNTGNGFDKGRFAQNFKKIYFKIIQHFNEVYLKISKSIATTVFTSDS